MQKFCPRCLLSEIDLEREFRHIYEYIEALPEDLKAPRELYEERLAICKNYDELLSGMCKKCGCYVEMRAAQKKGYCPSEKHHW